MDRPTTRRRALEITGAGVAMALLAGCADEEGEDDPADFEEETGNGQDQNGEEVEDDEDDPEMPE